MTNKESALDYPPPWFHLQPDLVTPVEVDHPAICWCKPAVSLIKYFPQDNA